ncbi:amidohydrolase family protein [Marinigracilibium pacificum]|uniref:Amidohydrolase family protein n=1 Tax=Marinigracilibium pacificum TaxID=2729599 RepID=A0A848J4F4_9BACT|nr:amidohydrolase family protein [Marinigracilibium pacificum]NMM49354.1 amidohydrolase family protein [Marinigracilibium pacificum]
MNRIFSTLFVFLFATILFAQNEPATYIHCGTILDVDALKELKDYTIVIEGNKIVSVKKGFTEVPSGASYIDLKGYTVIPGLMDAHVHLESESNPNRYIEKFTLEDADVAYRAGEYARRTLMAGFTYVRDLGGSGVNISLRNAINSGWAVGPRIITAGKSIATTGGHADPTNGMKKRLSGDATPENGVADGPYQAREAVRFRYKNGADVIKITATGGVLSVAKDGQGPQFKADELEAIISTAKEYGMRTAAHAHGAEGMKRAVEAGITSIEHGTLMTEEIMDLMKEKGTYLVPTLSAGKYVAEKAKIEGFYPAVIVPKALAIGPKIQDTFGKAYKRGVKIAFGTDAGVSPHGDNAKEFAYMVEAGMPAFEAIQSATLTTAQLFGVEEEVGQIKEGLYADIVAIEGDPLQNIELMNNVKFVMKDGKVYKSE